MGGYEVFSSFGCSRPSFALLERIEKIIGGWNEGLSPASMCVAESGVNIFNL